MHIEVASLVERIKANYELKYQQQREAIDKLVKGTNSLRETILSNVSVTISDTASSVEKIRLDYKVKWDHQ